MCFLSSALEDKPQVTKGARKGQTDVILCGPKSCGDRDCLSRQISSAQFTFLKKSFLSGEGWERVKLDGMVNFYLPHFSVERVEGESSS